MAQQIHYYIARVVMVRKEQRNNRPFIHIIIN
jgi:hypothetical protein